MIFWIVSRVSLKNCVKNEKNINAFLNFVTYISVFSDDYFAFKKMNFKKKKLNMKFSYNPFHNISVNCNDLA